MIPVALIALGLLVGGTAVALNWQEIENWLKDFLPKVQSAQRDTRHPA